MSTASHDTHRLRASVLPHHRHRWSHPLHVGGWLHRLEVRHVDIPAGLGIRVLVASDIHAHPRWFPQTAVRRVVDAINSISDIDAVLLPGDFVGSQIHAIDWCVEELDKLDAPAFASLGNHDVCFRDFSPVIEAFERSKVRLLRNEAVAFREGLWIAGLDSCLRKQPDIAAMQSAVPAGERAVVLGHEPRLATLHEEFLHVSGHTHHGQVRVPFLAPLTLPRNSQPYTEGLYRLPGGRYVYTGSGVGYSNLPFRFNCPPEITIVDM